MHSQYHGDCPLPLFTLFLRGVFSIPRVAAVTAKTSSLAESALQSVAEKGIMQTAREGASATIGLAGEAAKGAAGVTRQMDRQYLGGGLTTIAATAAEGVNTVREGMRELVPSPSHSTAGVRVVVTSAAFSKVSAVRSAVQQTMGPCSVRAVPAPSGIAEQPVGFAAGRLGAVQRIENIAETGAEPPRLGEVRLSLLAYYLCPKHAWQDGGYLFTLESHSGHIRH